MLLYANIILNIKICFQKLNFSWELLRVYAEIFNLIYFFFCVCFQRRFSFSFSMDFTSFWVETPKNSETEKEIIWFDVGFIRSVVFWRCVWKTHNTTIKENTHWHWFWLKAVIINIFLHCINLFSPSGLWEILSFLDL